MSKPSPDDVPFEVLLKRMEEIATSIERGDLTLEASLSLFEEGVRLGKQGTARLDAADKKLEILLQDGSTQPLPPMGT